MAIADIAKQKTQVSALPTLVCFSHAVSSHACLSPSYLPLPFRRILPWFSPMSAATSILEATCDYVAFQLSNNT